MPRFPVAFGKRKSTADNLDNAQIAGPSFRVLDRSEIGAAKQPSGFDGGARLAARNSLAPRTSVVPDTASLDDNIFADLKTNRGSGSSNTTKTTSTDNSSRHSNASTAPSSADMNTNPAQEDWRNNARKTSYDHIPLPPVPKDRSSGFLKAAGRSFSFGGKNKSSQPATLVEEPSQMEPVPPLPAAYGDEYGRPRATTSSTVSTAMPPKVDQDFTLDLGGDFSRMLLGGDKRQSVATLRDEPNRQAAPRSLTGGRATQPSPLHLDQTSKVEPSPFSWGSRHSDDNLLTASPIASPVGAPVPRHGSPLADRSQNTGSPLDKKQKKMSGFFGRKSTTPENDVEEEDARLLKESLSSVNKFLAGNTATDSQSSGRYRRNEELTTSSGYRQVSSESRVSRLDKMEDDNLFSTSLAHSSRVAQRYVARKPSPPRNKVMTPAQFERYRKDKERQNSNSETTKPEVKDDDDDDDEDHYEDDDDEVEKSKQAAKQRRKQEAHMTVYRQQMMKVTGEQSSSHTFSSRPHIPQSISSPNLGVGGNNGPSPSGTSDPSDEDEEVPLAILAAHGFPSKSRPPARLSTMMSNPNLQAAAAPSYQRPMSVAGDVQARGPGGRLPAFAKNLPQDPYLGAGLIHQAPRESFALGGGAPASAPGGVPPGGLVGVIASEERSRAMRRGSPAIDTHRPLPPMGGPQQFDPMAGIPPQMMYPSMPGQQMPGMMTPQDQAQMQMNAQMQQFMQMQMQFMQIMAANGQGNQQRPGSHHASQSMGMMGPGGMIGPAGMPMGMPGMPGMGMGNPDMMRHSFVDNGSVMDLPMPQRPDHTRTMSLVQPSSASWVQPPPHPAGYAPSIRVQGINGAYAPSIAPSERSNIGLPGRYRPVSQMPGTMDPQLHMRKSSTMSGALGTAGWDHMRKSSSKSPTSPLGSIAGQAPPKRVAEEEEDDDEGWEAMKAKREKKKGLWKSKGKTGKGFGADLAALIH